ncbi:VOC family protein [Aurantimonas sp. DM33-3]|uniref:VOC family protein n=1 Tax=Aurantimonas sp. DM33-3 TaxID=2766955 RepID=UPI0016527FA6|nr:VOC family protein [Aurantimonas sp. DM33-3]MBC6714921.1 VOC family protein [Aurantimonas sp. DM33-3]
MTPPLSGLLETCLYVDDMARSKAFYAALLGIEPLFEEDRICVFRLPDGTVLILFARGSTLEPVTTPDGTIPPHDGQGPIHFALGIPPGSVNEWRRHLEACGVAVESEVQWSRGRGNSLYFRDPDGHAAELATRELWSRS